MASYNDMLFLAGGDPGSRADMRPSDERYVDYVMAQDGIQPGRSPRFAQLARGAAELVLGYGLRVGTALGIISVRPGGEGQ